MIEQFGKYTNTQSIGHDLLPVKLKNMLFNGIPNLDYPVLVPVQNNNFTAEFFNYFLIDNLVDEHMTSEAKYTDLFPLIVNFLSDKKHSIAMLIVFVSDGKYLGIHKHSNMYVISGMSLADVTVTILTLAVLVMTILTLRVARLIQMSGITGIS